MPLHAVRLHGAARRLHEGRHQVDGLHKVVDDRAGAPLGIVEDHRNPHAFLVEQLLFAEPVVAQIVAVVAGERDHCVFHPALFLEEGEQAAHMVVDLLHQSHIGGDHRAPHLVAGEAPAVLMGHEGGVDGMRVPAFVLVTVGSGDGVGPVEAVIGGGRDIGPVRLDIGEVEAPGFLALPADELHRPAGHVGGLGVLGLHAGGQRGIAQIPSGELFAVGPLGGVGEVVPGVGAVIAALPEPAVVGEVRVGGHVGMQPVVALIGLEAAFGEEDAGIARRVDAEAGHALPVSRHVRLADERGAQPERTQPVAEREFAHRQRDIVPGGAVAEHVAPRVEGHARGAADRRLAVGAGEARSLRREAVQMRRLQRRMAVTGQIVPAQLVRHDEQDVANARH